MHVPASAPAVFIETEETDLTWAGLWCRAPATPTISGASEGSGVCDGAGKGPLASVVCVPAVLVFVPWPGQCRRLLHLRFHTGSAVSLFMWGCAGTGPRLSPFLLFIETWLLSILVSPYSSIVE